MEDRSNEQRIMEKDNGTPKVLQALCSEGVNK
jgi:hypothetical protein